MASSWPSSALVDGVKIGVGSCSDSRSPGGSSMPADLAGGLVVLPARAGDVAAHDALDRQHLQLAHGHRAAADLVGDALGRRDEWLGTMCAGLVEPEGGDAGQDAALVRDRRSGARRHRSRCGRRRPAASGRPGRRSHGPCRRRRAAGRGRRRRSRPEGIEGRGARRVPFAPLRSFAHDRTRVVPRRTSAQRRAPTISAACLV